VRWTPSQIQFQILERLFEQDNGTPNKQHLKEIAHELRQHGQIAETNVYNWFQNRKARTKRRHQQVARRCRTHLNQAKGAQQVTQLILPELAIKSLILVKIVFFLSLCHLSWFCPFLFSHFYC